MSKQNAKEKKQPAQKKEERVEEDKEKEGKESKTKLNPNQERFCWLYSGGGEWFGNAIKSYIIAFNVNVPVGLTQSGLSKAQKKKYDTAATLSQRLLKKVAIQRRCAELLKELNREDVVDREIIWTILQRFDLNPKIAAAREFNKVRKRVSDIDVGFPQTLIDLIKNALKKDEPKPGGDKTSHEE